MNNDDDFFLKQMRGVNPIKKKHRINKEEFKTKNLLLKNNKPNQTKQLKNKPPDHNKKTPRSQFNLEKLDIKKSIKKRSFTIDKKIDFHGKTLIESEEVFADTILNCYSNGQRCLLFITGKGLFKAKNTGYNDSPKLYHGVIRSSFIQWAKNIKFSKYILSFDQASIEHGGDGAFYVYLRKKKN